MVREKESLELFSRLHVGACARTLHFPVSLGRMNLAHRLNAIGTFSNVTGTIVDIVFLREWEVDYTIKKINSFVNG